MPLYTSKCSAGHKEDFWAKIDARDIARQCACGLPSLRVLAAPALRPEIPSYQSPIDGRWIDSRAARREDLARSGSMEWDPGMRSDFARTRADNLEKSYAEIDRAVEKTAGEMVSSGLLPPL